MLLVETDSVYVFMVITFNRTIYRYFFLKKRDKSEKIPITHVNPRAPTKPSPTVIGLPTINSNK